jgi:lysophospholipase L1-like esterase
MSRLDPVLSRMMNIQARLRRGEKTRILAFGSSNTERFLPGVHWVDVLELALRDTYGRNHQCLNAGICGNTSTDLLARFEEDAALFQPHVTIITIGGNDSNPARNLSAARFADNLLELHRLFIARGSQVVFQTYYAPDPARCDDLAPFFNYMQVVRRVARQTGAELVDHLARWEPYRKAHPEHYLLLMHDGFHVNPRGHAVLGLDTARHFGARPAPDSTEFWDEALGIQERMDQLVADS